jgi:hypothetical protein
LVLCNYILLKCYWIFVILNEGMCLFAATDVGGREDL